MWNLDVGIILIYSKIYFLWGWTFENSQRLTFDAFFWELIKICSFMITTSLNAFAPQKCKAGLDWCVIDTSFQFIVIPNGVFPFEKVLVLSR